MAEKYKSIEERVIDTETNKRIGIFFKDFGTSVYGGIASLFRVPTAIRKIKNKQTILDKREVPYCGGYVLGMTVGVSADLGIIIYSISICEAIKGNYIPLAVLGATNLASGLYELGRLKQSKQENLELKTEQEKDK